MTPAPSLLVIAGPTATGKTGLSIRLAETLRGSGVAVEIVSADSRQVYRGLDIGTAKASREERARVPHHGLDLVDPDMPFSLADYVDHARNALDAIAERGAIAFLVGGTGLYIRAIASGIDTAALPHDPGIRTRLEAELAADGVAALAERLRTEAPILAAGTDLRNSRRVVRALEIAALRGDGPRPPVRGYPGPILWIGLSAAPDVHRGWITDRARSQFRGGLLDEARGLRERYDPDLPAFSALGYREAFAVLDGALRGEEAIELDAVRTAAFARRQRTWFRAEPAIEWLDVTTDMPDHRALDRVTGWLASPRDG